MIRNPDYVIGFPNFCEKITIMTLPSQFLKLDPLQEMDDLRTMISNETFSVSGIVNSLQNLIPNLQKNFQGFIHGFSKSEPAAQLKGNERDFLKQVEGRVYLNLSPLLAYVPEGLDVPYLEYLSVLQDAVLHCHDNTLKILNDYSVYLAQIITNRQLKITTMPLDATYAKMEKTRQDLTQRLAKCFKPGSSKAEARYGDVVGRNADWVEVFKDITRIDHLVNTIDRSVLHKKAEECNQQLNTIIKQIRNHEFEGAGPEVTNNLANGAYQAGAELEFFAATYFRVMTLNQAIGDTMRKVGEILKDETENR
jgi:hypothetical protein